MTALKVLLVEDDAMLSMLFVDMIEAMGHSVCAVEQTQLGAITAARRHAPDLMIVDAQLSGGSGIVAVTQILRTGFIPHVFISGNMVRLQALGPDVVVLLKPFGEVGLAQAISDARSPRPAVA